MGTLTPGTSGLSCMQQMGLRRQRDPEGHVGIGTWKQAPALKYLHEGPCAAATRSAIVPCGKMLLSPPLAHRSEKCSFCWAHCYFHPNQGFEGKEVETYGKLTNDPSPQDGHILVPGTCEYVTSNGKRDLAGVSKFRILRWEIILAYLGECGITTRALKGGKREDAVLLALRMEVYGHSLEAGKSKKIDFP